MTAAPSPALRQSLTACLIAQDEEARIGDCLRSIAFCDEIVVVDSGSTDATRRLAAAAGARVVNNPWPGFAAQRNVAIDHATSDWILEIDCDERVSAPLQADIERFLADPAPGVDIGALPRRNRLLGHWLGPSAKFPEYQFRLLRRGAYRHDEARTVHEGLTPEGPVFVADGDLEHLMADGWGELLRDWWRYAALEAQMLREPRPPAAYVKGMLVRPLQKLAFRLLIHGGWRDGWPGLVKIGAECASDAVVWARALKDRRRAGAPTVRQAGHFGVHGVRSGPLRLVAIGSGTRAARTAAAWLQEAARAEPGAETVLITDGEGGADRATRIRHLPRLGPLTGARALDAELQIRPADAVLAVGRDGRLACRLTPSSALDGAPVVGPEADPASTVAAVTRRAG